MDDQLIYTHDLRKSNSTSIGLAHDTKEIALANVYSYMIPVYNAVSLLYLTIYLSSRDELIS